MTTREVLIAARGVQERRGYDWNNGGAEPGPCCPGASIAAVLGEDDYGLPHPARDLLAEQFTCGCGRAGGHYRIEAPGTVLSHSVFCEESDRGYEFSLPEILARYDRAIESLTPQEHATSTMKGGT